MIKTKKKTFDIILIVKRICIFFLAPLVKIKQAIQRIKQECQQMDVRVGVVQHILLQAKMKERTNQNKSIKGGDDEDDGIMQGY